MRCGRRNRSGKRIDLHAGYHHSASFKHMGRPTSGWCISRLVVGVFGLRIALALAWNTTEGQKHLFALYRLDRLRRRRHFGRHYYLRVNCQVEQTPAINVMPRKKKAKKKRTPKARGP